MGADNVKRIHSKIAFATIPVLLLAATVAISFVITEDAFARERYSGDSTSQAAAVNNECLNPIFDSNEEIDNAVGVGNCAGTVSQQDESGSASAPITSQTANPDIELQRATTATQPPLTAIPLACVACFSTLTTDEQTQFLNRVNQYFPHIPPIDTSMGFRFAIIQLCQLFEAAGDNAQFPEAMEILDTLLSEFPPIVDETTSLRIQRCIGS